MNDTKYINNQYTFIVGHREVTISAATEAQAWDCVQQFGEEGQSIQLIRVKYLIPVGEKSTEDTEKLIKMMINGYSKKD